jgi:glycosyltransferase involved in cell wall biosynthesis
MPEPSERPAIAASPLSVVLPAFDEGPDLEDVIAGWVAFLDSLDRDYEILLINDGSTNDTRARADRLALNCPRLRVLHHERHCGFGAALRTGIGEARYPLVATSTSTTQFQPRDLTRLLEWIDKVDLVTGYRIWRPLPFWHVWLDRVQRLVLRVVLGLPTEPKMCSLGWARWKHRLTARWLFGVRVHDPECPFRLFRKSIFDRVRIQSESAFALIEILAKANFLGSWIAQVPVTCLPGPDEGTFTAAELPVAARRDLMRVWHEPDFGPAILPSPTPPVEKPVLAAAAPAASTHATTVPPTADSLDVN